MHINRLVERFLRETGLPPTKFGRLAARDPRLVFDMRYGRELGENVDARVRRFMAEYRTMRPAKERTGK
ncbi:MAG: hypothetical protein ABI668_06705 [Sphingorhabdus sp.]